MIVPLLRHLFWLTFLHASPFPFIMNITTVSITGADDKVDPASLVKLSAEYPFVEWALLHLPAKEGQQRNPSAAWRTKLLTLLPREYVAVHLCGVSTFRAMLDGDESIFEELQMYGRVQLNINARHIDFTPAEVHRIYDLMDKHEIQIIVQLNSNTEEVIYDYLAHNPANNIDVLFDASRGRGEVPAAWPEPLGTHFCGYAGGLNPINIDEQTRKIVDVSAPDMTWIDMESGVRTDNEFDLDKVVKVLEAAKPYIVGL